MAILDIGGIDRRLGRQLWQGATPSQNPLRGAGTYVCSHPGRQKCHRTATGYVWLLVLGRLERT